MTNIIDLRNPQSKDHNDNAEQKSPILHSQDNPSEITKPLKKTYADDNPIKNESNPPLENIPRTIFWETPAFIQGKNKFALYSIFILIVASAVAVYLIRKETTFAILLGLFSIVLILNSSRKSRWMKISIDHLGITVDSDVYTFKDIMSFWIDYDDIDKCLILTMKKWYFPYLRIPIGKTNPLDIRSIMIDNIPEKKVEKGFIDVLIRRIGL